MLKKISQFLKFRKYSAKKAEKILLFNTLSKSKEEFKPLNAGHAKIYSCGPTVYNIPHIGNMRAFVFADILHRVLKYAGYNVKHVINITDVGHLTDDADGGEDKMEKRAQELKKSAQDIATEITNIFFDFLDELNVDRDEYKFPRATEYINEQVKIIKALEEKGYTYKTEDGVYFDTSLFPDYGKLGGIDKEGLKKGARVKVGEKKNPTDFALWKFSPKNAKRQQEWDSPWGVGFPGWHIECSAMIYSLLGEQIDIHTGGIEHIPVHHNNEIAQSESFTGKKPFVKYWLHNQHLKINNEKMSKSLGNVLTVRDLKKQGISPMALRYFYLTAHYRSELNFTDEAISSAQKAYDKILRAFEKLGSASGEPDDKYLTKFKEAVFDDLNTPRGLAVLWDLIKDDSVQSTSKCATILEFDKVLGLNIEKNARKVADAYLQIEDLPAEIKELVLKRQKARENKNWQEADKIRDELENLGYEVIDGKDGTKIKLLAP